MELAIQAKMFSLKLRKNYKIQEKATSNLPLELFLQTKERSFEETMQNYQDQTMISQKNFINLWANFRSKCCSWRVDFSWDKAVCFCPIFQNFMEPSGNSKTLSLFTICSFHIMRWKFFLPDFKNCVFLSFSNQTFSSETRKNCFFFWKIPEKVAQNVPPDN